MAKPAGRHAIITGGSSGIGCATAKLLAKQGYHITIIARDRAKLQTALDEIATAKADEQQRFYSVSADVADRNAIVAALDECIANLGEPDLLITSAGVALPGYFQELPIENFEKTMQINFMGTLYAVKAIVPRMQARGRGRIVLISSGAAFTGIFGYTSYGASKFALRGFAESLRSELKPIGIDVSIVYPPDTDTPQLAEENKVKPLETKMIAGSHRPLSAEAVANAIVRGIDKQKFAIAPGFEMSLLMRVNSIAAGLLYRYFDWVIKKARKAKQAEPGKVL